MLRGLTIHIACSKRFSGDYADNYFFFRQDIRGSVTNIVDKNGNVVKGFGYDAYGNTAETGNSDFINSTAYTGAVKQQQHGQ